MLHGLTRLLSFYNLRDEGEREKEFLISSLSFYFGGDPSFSDKTLDESANRHSLYYVCASSFKSSVANSVEPVGSSQHPLSTELASNKSYGLIPRRLKMSCEWESDKFQA